MVRLESLHLFTSQIACCSFAWLLSITAEAARTSEDRLVESVLGRSVVEVPQVEHNTEEPTRQVLLASDKSQSATLKE